MSLPYFLKHELSFKSTLYLTVIVSLYFLIEDFIICLYQDRHIEYITTVLCCSLLIGLFLNLYNYKVYSRLAAFIVFMTSLYYVFLYVFLFRSGMCSIYIQDAFILLFLSVSLFIINTKYINKIECVCYIVYSSKFIIILQLSSFISNILFRWFSNETEWYFITLTEPLLLILLPLCYLYVSYCNFNKEIKDDYNVIFFATFMSMIILFIIFMISQIFFILGYTNISLFTFISSGFVSVVIAYFMYRFKKLIVYNIELIKISKELVYYIEKKEMIGWDI